MALVGLAILLYQALDAQAAVQDEQRVRDAILKGTAAELDWYKQPDSNREQELERYFVPVKDGGDRLRQISANVDTFRSKKRHLASTGSRALFVNRLELQPDRATAFVQTSESWYQPLLEVQNGSEQVVQQPPDQLNLYTAAQFYILQKIGGTWLIQSNPAPVAP